MTSDGPVWNIDTNICRFQHYPYKDEGCLSNTINKVEPKNSKILLCCFITFRAFLHSLVKMSMPDEQKNLWYNSKVENPDRSQRKKIRYYKMKNEGPERLEILKGMNDIRRVVLSCSSEVYMSDDDLVDLGVVVSSMSLETGKSGTFQDSFFEPFKQEVLDKRWVRNDLEIRWPQFTDMITHNFTAGGRVGELASHIACFDFYCDTAGWISRRYSKMILDDHGLL